MKTAENTIITVEAIINAPVEKVWDFWTDPKHIVKWNAASDDWHTPFAENDLRVGGKFLSRMAAKDGSREFDFIGQYSKLEALKNIEYSIEDGRKVAISFISNGNETRVIEKFEAESTFPVEMQKEGWQSILNNFKRYVESRGKMEKLHFNISINAPVETVYRKMLGENSYKEWTSEFNPTSHYKGSWEKGAKILFIGTDKDGNMGGMISKIRENIPNEYVSVEHLGLLQGDKEIMSGADVEGWVGAMENYSFKRENDKTNLLVDVDMNEEFKSYFQETWPKALNKLKSICENNEQQFSD